MSIKINYIKPLFIISILFFLFIAGFYYIHWRSLNANILEIKEQNRKYYEHLLTIKNYGPFQIDFKQINKKQVIIDPTEIEKINTHIKVLTEEVYKETNRAESIIDKDLDRLNLYIGVGIGFLTILGIFVPVLTNVLSVQDLRDKLGHITKNIDKMEKMEPKIEKAIFNSNTAIQNASTALAESKKVSELSSNINKIEKKTNEVIPKLNNIALHNSISRFFNISSIVITKAMRIQNYDGFINILIPIKNGFEECKNGNHSELENSSFKTIIDDFILFLQTDRFRLQSIFDKNLQKSFDELIILLNKLKNSSDDNENLNYQNLINKLDDIIQKFKDKNVKDKPAA